MDDIKNDPRFAHIVSDPKFRLMPKSKKKVKIDSRFQSVFSSKHFSHKTDIDKRGRPVLDPTKRSKNVMQRFYELSDDEEVTLESESEVEDLAHKKHKVKKKKQAGESLESHPIKNKQHQKTKQEKRPAESSTRQKVKDTVEAKHENSGWNSSKSHEEISGLDNMASADEDSKDTSTDEDDEDDNELAEFTKEHVLEETEIDHKWNELHTDAPSAVESTHRLAVCNMDWDFVKAQDLFVLFKSFVSEGGSLKSVTIYPSEFGKERMAEEARLGPREMREQSESDNVVPEKGSTKKKKKKALDQKQLKKSVKDQGAVQTEKLREYQLNRLRYYFAVVECDSAGTAEIIYNECDGREYLLSSVTLDLRFIPDGMTFDDSPKDVFSEDQSILEYEPNKFSSTALCQAKVDVTWDETDFDRLSRRVAGLPQKELESIVEENKYAEIIAPPESDSDEDVQDRLKDALEGSEGDKVFTEEDKIAMYRRLLMDEIEGADEDGDEKETEGKEYVWQPGLKSSLVKKMQRKERKQTEGGVVSEYLEKQRDKKRKKKAQKAGDKTDVVNSQEETQNQKDRAQTSPLKRKRKRSEVNDGETENAADLELLVMDDTDVPKQASKNPVKMSKKQKKKSKKKDLMEEKDEAPLDVNDPRFAAIYTSHHYHIDPTSSQFKKTKNMSVLVNEQIKRRGKSEPTQTAGSPQTARSVSQALVDSFKLKMRKSKT